MKPTNFVIYREKGLSNSENKLSTKRSEVLGFLTGQLQHCPFSVRPHCLPEAGGISGVRSGVTDQSSEPSSVLLTKIVISGISKPTKQC